MLTIFVGFDETLIKLSYKHDKKPIFIKSSNKGTGILQFVNITLC